MAELIVVGFKEDVYRALEALNMLKDLNSSWIVDLSDAVAVYRDHKGKLRVDQSYQMTTGEGAVGGGLFGGLIGALLAAPSAGLSTAVAAGKAAAVRQARSLHARSSWSTACSCARRRPNPYSGRRSRAGRRDHSP